MIYYPSINIATISYILQYRYRVIALSPGYASPLTETCDTNALPIQSTKLPLVSPHYRHLGIDLFPGCASSLTEPCDSDILSIQST